LKVGPYFCGENLSFADIMFAPILHRTILLDYFKGVKSIPEECDQVHRLWKNIQQHPSFVATALSDENLIDYYAPYVSGDKKLKYMWAY
jgi:glutathione S-transferase